MSRTPSHPGAAECCAAWLSRLSPLLVRDEPFEEVHGCPDCGRIYRVRFDVQRSPEGDCTAVVTSARRVC